MKISMRLTTFRRILGEGEVYFEPVFHPSMGKSLNGECSNILNIHCHVLEYKFEIFKGCHGTRPYAATESHKL